ncbi:hypothetical protein F4678DRAFT_467267 [Xylaria arbuscula]|nr:hypothetical protein F4678DRAFT_467267 [Xylaria arbuscula]
MEREDSFDRRLCRLVTVTEDYLHAQIQSLNAKVQRRDQTIDQLRHELEQGQQRADTALRNSKDEAEKQAREILQPMVDLLDNAINGLQATKEARKGLNTKLEVWSSDRANLLLLKEACQKLTEDQKITIENGKRLAELLDVQNKMDATLEWHRSQFDALRPTEAEFDRASRHGHNKLEQENEISHVAGRRVTIQSPPINDEDEDEDEDEDDAKNDEEKWTPISIEEERMARRHSIPLKGILKPAVWYSNPTLAASGETTAHKKRKRSRNEN